MSVYAWAGNCDTSQPETDHQLEKSTRGWLLLCRRVEMPDTAGEKESQNTVGATPGQTRRCTFVSKTEPLSHTVDRGAASTHMGPPEE